MEVESEKDQGCEENKWGKKKKKSITWEGRYKAGCECLTVALHVCPVVLPGVMRMNFRICKTLHLQ